MRTAKLTHYKSGKPAIKIYFPYSRKTIQQLKRINHIKSFPPNAHHKEFFMICPATKRNVKQLRYWGFAIAPELDDLFLPDVHSLTDFAEPLEVPFLRQELLEFQKLGVSVLEEYEGNVLLADDMGLGKTVQVLAFLQLHPELRPVICIVPANVKYDWAKMALEWMTEPNLYVLEGRPEKTSFVNPRQYLRHKYGPHSDEGPIVIVNYAIFANKREKVKNAQGKTIKQSIRRSGWVDHLIEKDWSYVVLDEMQYIRNTKTHRTEDVKRFCEFMPHITGISGTPALNKPIELFNGLNLINPVLFPDFFWFAKRYCDAKHNRYGWDFSGHSNERELHYKLASNIMIRRTWDDVGDELPDNRRKIVPIEITNRNEYNAAEQNIIAWIRRNLGKEKSIKAQRAEQLAKFNTLKKLALEGKLKSALSWIADFLESGHKLVTFSTHRTTINAQMKRFGNIAVRYDGLVNAKQRQRNKEAFQNDDSVRLLVGMIDVEGRPAGIGNTFTAASVTSTLELQWSPLIHRQAEKRVQRLSQQAQHTLSYYLVAQNTIEEKLAEIIDEKAEVLDMIIDGKTTDNTDLLTELLARIDL